MKVDLNRLKADLDAVLAKTAFHGDVFKVLPVNQRPGADGLTETDLSGRYYARLDDRYEEVAVEDIVDEAAYTELNPIFSGTAFEDVFNALKQRFTLGRMRVLGKVPYNCNHGTVTLNPGSISRLSAIRGRSLWSTITALTCPPTDRFILPTRGVIIPALTAVIRIGFISLPPSPFRTTAPI